MRLGVLLLCEDQRLVVAAFVSLGMGANKRLAQQLTLQRVDALSLLCLLKMLQPFVLQWKPSDELSEGGCGGGSGNYILP